MKKKLLFAAVVVVLASVTTMVSNAKQSELKKSEIVSEAVEALYSSETANTGPSYTATCSGGGTKKLCASSNRHPCTETDCF